MAQRNVVTLLWSCTVGLVIVLPVLLLLRKTWFPEEEKRLRTKNTVGAAIRGLLRQSSSAKSVPVRSTSTVDCQPEPLPKHSRYKISMSLQHDGPYSVSKEERASLEHLLRSKMVLLEDCQLECDDGSYAVKGVLAVHDKDLVNNIFIRNTKNGWESFTDVPAEFVSSHSADDGTNFDRFEFKIPFNTDGLEVAAENDVTTSTTTSKSSCSIEFAIAYQVHSNELWDNNDERNYQINLILGL